MRPGAAGNARLPGVAGPLTFAQSSTRPSKSDQSKSLRVRVVPPSLPGRATGPAATSGPGPPPSRSWRQQGGGDGEAQSKCVTVAAPGDTGTAPQTAVRGAGSGRIWRLRVAPWCPCAPHIPQAVAPEQSQAQCGACARECSGRRSSAWFAQFPGRPTRTPGSGASNGRRRGAAMPLPARTRGCAPESLSAAGLSA
jgi:hypothetical protein